MRMLRHWSIVTSIAVSFIACSANIDSGSGAAVAPDGGSTNTSIGSDGGGVTTTPTKGSDAGDDGVAAKGGGPMTYTAPTDTNAHTYSSMAAPNEGVPTADPDFVHSSSGGICNSTQTCFIRATGPNLWSQISSQFPSVSGGPVGFATESGTIFNTWDTDDTHFVIGINAGNQSAVMNFDTSSGAITLNQIPPHTITAGTGLFHFSKTERHMIMGYPNLSEMDVTDPAHAIKQVVDLGATCNFPITVTTTGGGWDTSLDNTNAGSDTRYASYIGPQNTAELAVVYDRPSNTCYWYDTKLDSMGGNNGAPTCTGCGGFTGTIHGLGISSNGDFADISDNGVGVVIWKVGTTTVTHAAAFDAAGHRAAGQHTMFSGPSVANGKWLGADLSTPTTTFSGASRLSSTTDQHNGWVNVNATETNPMYTLPYANGTNGACVDATDPAATNEVQMVAMDGSGSTYRFMHARKNTCLDEEWFYHEVSGNVSRSGKFAVFSTDWDGTLGQFTVQGITHYRDDAFVVELR